MMHEWYVLDSDGQPQPATQMEWAEQRRDNPEIKRIVYTVLGDSTVSTVFLGLNHQYTPDGPPMIFETLVFGGLMADECERYSTPEEARAGHEQMCRQVNLRRAAAFAFTDVPNL